LITTSMDISLTLTLSDGPELDGFKAVYQNQCNIGNIDADALAFEDWVANLVQGDFNVRKISIAREAKQIIVATIDTDAALASSTAAWTKPIKPTPVEPVEKLEP
jgi:hypothetical protein